MRRYLTIITLILGPGCQTATHSMYQGKSIANECPPKVDGAVISSIGKDVSLDLAKSQARSKLIQVYGVPPELLAALPIRDLSFCVQNGQYQAAAGISKDSLSNLRSHYGALNESRVSEIARRARLKSWNQIVSFLNGFEANLEPLELSDDSSITACIVADEPVVSNSIASQLLKIGIAVKDDDSCQIKLATDISYLTLNRGFEPFQYVSASLTITLQESASQSALYRFMAKGSGGDVASAKADAIRKLSGVLDNEFLSKVAGGGHD